MSQQSLIVTANQQLTGNNGFARINTAGTGFIHGFRQIGSTYAPIPPIPAELKIAVVRDAGNAWPEGTLIYGDRIPSGPGEVLCLQVVPPTAVPGVPGSFGVLSETISIATPLDSYSATPERIVCVAVDETPSPSILGQGAICASNYGRVWRYSPTSNPQVTLLATVKVDSTPGHEALIEALIVVANDVATETKYGTRIAGKILVGADAERDLNGNPFFNKGLWAINATSFTSNPDRILNEPVEDVDLVRDGQTFLVNDAGDKIFQFSPSQFTSIPNTLILTVENAPETVNGQIRQLVKTSGGYSSDVLLAQFDSPFIGQGLEHAIFAPISLNSTAPPTASVARTPADGGIPASPSIITEPPATGTQGSYRFSRTGSVAKDLIVRFRFIETATTAMPGSDFQLLGAVQSGEEITSMPMTITIGAGWSFVDLGIQALADSLVEVLEPATIEILPSINYSIGTASATINIMNSTPATVPANLAFTITPLFVTSGAGSDSYAFGVTSVGGVVGQYRDPYPLAANPFKGFYRTAQGTYYVPAHGFNGYQMWPYGVNDSGVMVGAWIGNAGNPVSAGAFKWSIAGGTVTLNGIPGVAIGEALAYGINNAGEIVGRGKGPNGRFQAVIWNQPLPTTAQPLGTISGVNALVDSVAYSIGSSGKFVGVSGVTGVVGVRAFRASGALDDVSNLGTPHDAGVSEAYDINGDDEVVGRATFVVSGSQQTRAFYRGAGGGANIGFRDLGVLPGGNQSSAQSINNNGHCVGWSRTTSTGSNRAVLWLNNGQMRNLNDTSFVSPLTGWSLTQAEDIGSFGHIVGWGIKDGVIRAFLLTPNSINY